MNILLQDTEFLFSKWGELMNGVLVMYKVKDFKKWKLNNENGAGTRKSKGSRDAYVYNKKNNPNELVVLYNWDDLDNAREYFESEEFKNQMEDAGLNSDPEIQYLEEKTRLMG